VFLRELDIRRVVIRRECGDAGFGFSVGKVGLEVA